MGITYSSHYLTDLGTRNGSDNKKRQHQSLKTGFYHVNPSEYDELKSLVSMHMLDEGGINTPIIIDDVFWVVLKEKYSDSIGKNYLLLERVIPEEDFKEAKKGKSFSDYIKGFEMAYSRGTIVKCSSKEQQWWVFTGARKLVTESW